MTNLEILHYAKIGALTEFSNVWNLLQNSKNAEDTIYYDNYFAKVEKDLATIKYLYENDKKLEKLD